MSMDSNPPPPAEPTPPPPVAPAPAPPPATAPPPAGGGSSNMVLAAIGYPIWICALVAVLIEKNDRDVKFHGWNGLFWNIGYTVVMVALFIVSIVLRDVPGIGSVARLVMRLLPLAFLVLSIIFAVNAYNRKPVNIPVISDMARKQAGV
ncbi:MAG: DUF4870 domain-containing protein [Armatimonadetes bacterium]|nr:DUF4870 domain-containing protein [Armatimonadota bacterium]